MSLKQGLTKSTLNLFVGSLLLLSLTACMDPPEGSLQVGKVAPLLKTKTLADVGGDFSKMTSYRYPDERMYQYSLDDALAQGKVVIVEFATPGHCTVCDKQLQMLKGLLTKYESDIIIVHMDQYFNPEAFISYRVKGDPWTFVIDREGTVRYKRPGRVLYGELDAVLKKVVG